jgi:thioredoxin:protein disulfide reductase
LAAGRPHDCSNDLQMTRMRTFLASLIACSAVLAASGAAAASGKVTLEIETPEDGARRGSILEVDAIASIEDGWHVHSNTPPEPYLIATELKLELPEGFAASEIYYPPAEEQTFAFAPDLVLSVYEGKLGIAAAVPVPADYQGASLPITAVLRYQACNDTTCLPPATARARVEVPVSDAVPGAPGEVDATPGVSSLGGQELFGRWLAERGIVFTILAVALLGLGLNLTPCVYPLISVTVAYFGRQSEKRGAVAWLAFLYVLGIALSFSALGVTAALSGGVFGAALQNPLVIVGLAAVMVVLALGSFGLYQLRPPAALMTWAGGSGAAGGGAAGAMFMGLTMGIVAAPCVGPIVLGLLLFVGSRQDAWLGFVLFFALALGMGAPYMLLAVAAGSIQKLPRSGEWLLWTERLFGCILLALAAYFLSTILPEPLKSLLLPAVVVVSALYLGFIERAGASLRWFPAIKRAVGIAMFAFGIWLALPAPESRAIAWESLDTWLADQKTSRPVLIDFVAEWCIPCREMEHSTYVDEDVVAEAERFRMVKADLTDDNDSNSKVVREFEVRGVPTLILRSASGEETHRMVGYVGPQELLAAMKQVE